jgi:hypothetical protein
MIRTVEAVIDEQGGVHLLEPVRLPSAANACALLSEAALAEDWSRPEEDEAWSHLQEVR